MFSTGSRAISKMRPFILPAADIHPSLPVFLGCTWVLLTSGPWCSCVLNSYIISSLIFPSPPVTAEMPSFSQLRHLWLFSVLIRNYAKCCYSSFIMSTSSKCEKRGCTVHISVISYLSLCSLLLCSFLSPSYFFLMMGWGKRSLYRLSSHEFMHLCSLFHTFVSIFMLKHLSSEVLHLIIVMFSSATIIHEREIEFFLGNSWKHQFNVQHPWKRKIGG